MNMNFTTELSQAFLNGGQVVSTINGSKGRKTIIVRMPKGQWIPDFREGQEDNSFEYVIAQTAWFIDRLDVIGWKNGTKRGVEKKVYDEQLEYMFKDRMNLPPLAEQKS